MRRKCCVPTCNSAEKCSICQVGFSYFKAPRDPLMIKKWELALGLKDQGLKSRDRVCSSHFRKGDIITKRFVSLKRPSTNSKMILEIAKLDRDTVPSLFRHEIKQCNHGKVRKTSTAIKSSSSRASEASSAASARMSSQSDETDDSSADDRSRDCERRKLRSPTRRDYRQIAESVEHRSKRRQIRALKILRVKWLDKGKHLEKEIRLLEEKIHELEMNESLSDNCE